MPRLFPRLTATRLQATTYLLGIALFSIAFLVFLNSSLSFVVTDVIGRKHDVGDVAGTLGFADELLALVACPLWGLLSDRVGVRAVAAIGYGLVGFSLICLVQSTNVYPELLLGRLGFSLGAAACSTMVTAVLPAMVAERAREEDDSGEDEGEEDDQGHNGSARVVKTQDLERTSRNGRIVIKTNTTSSGGDGNGRVGRSGSIGHGPSPSLSSELTITPTRYASNSQSRENARANGTGTDGDGEDEEEEDRTAGTSQLAGFVGLFTGAGALVALAVFLPLPAYLQEGGLGKAQSVQVSFYLVGAVAFVVAGFIFVGLRHLPGEEHKSLSALFRTPYDETTHVGPDGHPHTTLSPAPSYYVLAKEALKLGVTDPDVGLGYLGGFVARASSVAISSFIPLFVNMYFIRHGLCVDNPDDLTDIRKNCQRAYKLAAALAGICETAALIGAPIFGWLGGRAATTPRGRRRRAEWPLLAATLFGIAGYVSFGLVSTPDAFHGDGGQWALLSAVLIGISQIGAIVCSLGLLSRGIHRGAPAAGPDRKVGMNGRRPGTAATLMQRDVAHGPSEGDETAALLPGTAPSVTTRGTSKALVHDRQRLKGSVAGIYSLIGGAGILILTKLGGSLFDTWSVGAPFFLMAIFNGVLLVAILGVGLYRGAIRNR